MYLKDISLLAFVTVSCFTVTLALSPSCKTEWKIDWNQQPPDWSNAVPFSNPGEILPGVTVHDTLKFVGLLWNAQSWQEIVGRLCIHYGPLFKNEAAEVQRECDLIVTALANGKRSGIEGRCALYWDQIRVDNEVRSLIGYYDQCATHYDDRPIQFDGSMCDLDPLATVYRDNLLEKSSRVTFDLLEWLGPSPFSGDLYGACSALRILLSVRIDQIIDELKNLLTYSVADGLEYLNLVDICSSDDQTVQDVLALLPISTQNDEFICGFLSGTDPSREEYLEKGAALVDTVLSVPVDEALCTNVLAFVSGYDPYGVIGYEITGRNLTSASSRSQLCREIASALSDNSPYMPVSYSFPEDQDIQTWTVQAGFLLPDFTFIDAFNVLGAFLRSNTLLDGGVVLCDVFESFLSEYESFLSEYESFTSEYEPSVSNMCTAFRNGDTALVERMCLVMSLPPYLHPSLRIPTALYAAVTGVDMARKLFSLEAISKDDVCSALDRYIHSNNNLQSLLRFGLDVCLSELLPIIDNICKDYDPVIDFIEGSSGLNRAEFRRIVRLSIDIILTHLGFSEQGQFCQTIAAGIDNKSGRAKSSLVQNIQQRALLFLTDDNRCIMSFQSLQQLFTSQKPTVDFSEVLTQYTGYDSINSVCEDLITFFDPGLCNASSIRTVPGLGSLFVILSVSIACLKFRL